MRIVSDKSKQFLKILEMIRDIALPVVDISIIICISNTTFVRLSKYNLIDILE